MFIYLNNYMRILDDIQLQGTGSVSTPEPNFLSLYLGTDGILYVKKSNGVITRIS